MKLIDKSALVAEIERRKELVSDPIFNTNDLLIGERNAYFNLLSFIDTLKVKEVDLMIHTIIAECCDWLAMNTNLSHDKIEGCRNLMLTVKEE